MFWQGYVQLERVVGKSEVGKKYIDEEFSPCSLSKLNLNFPTSVRAFQLQSELSNFGPNFPTSIVPISFRTFQLLVLSNCPFRLHVSLLVTYLSSFLDSLFDLSRSFALSLAASRFSSPAKPNPPRLLISSTSFRIGLGARREFPSPPPRRRGRHPLTVRPRSTSTRTRLPSIFRPSAYLYAPKYLLIYNGTD